MGTTAIAYVRVADASQGIVDGSSFQYEAVRQYCEQQGYRIVDVVRNIVGGKEANRYLREVARKAEKLKVDRIVAMQWDRFTRDTQYLLKIKNRLTKRNICIEIIK